MRIVTTSDNLITPNKRPVIYLMLVLTMARTLLSSNRTHAVSPRIFHRADHDPHAARLLRDRRFDEDPLRHPRAEVAAEHERLRLAMLPSRRPRGELDRSAATENAA